MFLAWVRFSILISNIILSNQLSPPAITTSTKCAVENQKIQGFTPSQFFQCVRKENELYFETRYCPNVKNTFYETEQRCLPNIGGGEVRCLISGKRCSHNILGPMAYPNKFKSNYYIVCLPKATHICRCYGNAIYDASTQTCRIISSTTDMGRDDSNGLIPKIICEKSGMHSTVELEYPNKQKCVLFCYQKYTNEQFKLNIICVQKTNLVDANVPIDIDSVTNGEENLPAEIRELIAQEFFKSTNSYDNLGWLLEKSTTENSQDEEKRKRTDITSIPTGETFVGSSSTEDVTITWATDQNIKENPFDPFSFKYDETTSEKIVLTSSPTEVIFDISHTSNKRATSTQLSEFSTSEGEPEKVTAQDGSVEWNSDKVTIPLLKDDEITIQVSEMSLVSSTIQDDTTQSVTNTNFKEIHANTPLSTTEYGNVQSIIDTNFTQRTFNNLLLVTEDGSKQSTTIDNNFNERTSNPLLLVTEKQTTITSVSDTIEDVNTKYTTETPSSSRVMTTADIIKSSSEKTSLASSISEDGNTQWTTEQNFKESTLSTVVEDKNPNQSSKNILFASVTRQGESMQSSTHATFIETSRTPFSTINVSPKETNSDNILIVTEEETTNPSNTIITSVTEDRGTKWNTNQNTIQTHSTSQFLTTEDIINTSTDKTFSASLTPEDGETQWTTDQNFKKSTANTLSTIMKNETTNQFNENLLFSSVTPEEESIQSTTYQNVKETTRTPFSATDNGLKETNRDTLLLITEEETTNPSKTTITSVSDRTDSRNTKWNTNQNPSETSPSTQFLTTENIIKFSKEMTSSVTLIAEDEETRWTSDHIFKTSTANTLSPILKNETTNPSSENLLLASVTSEGGSMQSTTYQTFTKTSTIPFLPTDDDSKETNSDTIVIVTEESTTNPSETTITSVSDTTDDTKNANWNTTQNSPETSSGTQFLTTENMIKSSNEKTSSVSLIGEDEETQWTSDQIFKTSTANILSPIVENETTNQFSENLLLASVTPESSQSTVYQLLIETSRTPSSTTDDDLKKTNSDTIVIVTEERTTNPSKTIITSVKHTTEDINTKWTINQNTIETSSSSQFLTTENIINTSSELTSLASLIQEDGETQWTSDQNFKKSTVNTLSPIVENETTNQSSDNLLLASVTPDSQQSTAYQPFIETSRTPFSRTDNGQKETNFNTKAVVTEEEITNPSKTIITSVTHTPEEGSTKWTTNQNAIKTSLKSQWLTTEDVTTISSDETSLASLTPEDGETQWTTDQNFKISTATTLSTTMNDEITNRSSENILLTSATPEDESIQFTTYPNFKGTSSTSFSTTANSGLNATNSGITLLITDDEITNQTKENLLLANVTPEEESVQSTTYRDFKETSSTPFLTTVDSIFKETNSDNVFLITEDEITNKSSENILSTSVTSGKEIVQSTTSQNFKEITGTIFSTTVDSNFKETNSGDILLIAEEDITNQSNENILLVGVTPENESVQSTTHRNFRKTTSTIFSTTVESNPKEKNFGDLLLITENEIINQSNENILLASGTPEGESVQSTTYQEFKEPSGTPYSTTVDSTLKVTNSGNLLLITDDEITNQSNENILLASVTPEGESVQSTTYQDFKETSGTPLSTTVESYLKETSSGTPLLIIEDEITSQSNEGSLLVSVTPEGESVQSTTEQDFKEPSATSYSTTVDYNLKETNSGNLLLLTEDVTINENVLLKTTTFDGKSTLFTPYHNFKENTPNSLFSTTEDEKANFIQTTSIALSPIIEDETIKSSSEYNLLASLLPEDGSVTSTPNEYSKQTTSSTRFSIMYETITPTSEIISVESLSTESGNVNSTENRDIQTENFNSFTSHSTTEYMPTTEFLNPNNWTELSNTKVTSQTDLLLSTTEQLRDKVTQEKLNTTPSSTTISSTSELLTPETESEISTLKETSSATYDDSTKLTYTPPKSVEVTLNLENNLQSTISESTSTPTILPSSNTQSQEIETDVNTLPSSSADSTSTVASITPSITSLSQIATIESSNWFSTENLQTNIPKKNLQSTVSSPHSTSDSIVLSTAITDISKIDEENLSSTTSLNGYSQWVSTTEDTEKPVDLSTTSENLFTTEIDTRLPVESSTASDNYEYQSIIPVSDITNSVNTLLPAEAISESTTANSQQISITLEPFDSKEYLSTGYSSTTQTTIFIEPAYSDKNDQSTEVFTTIENVKNNLNVEQIKDQNINDSPQSSVELEISTIAIKPNWDVTDGTSTSETFASNEYLEEPEYDPSSQGTYFGMAERCVCTGKMRYRNSCKKHYHCSKIGSLNRFIQSEIMECAYCFQFNAKKRICDFPENVPECAVDDGRFNRICTAEGNYSIPLERNCRKYYECKRNWRGVIALHVKICPIGRIFSERLQKCVKGCRCRNAQQLPDRCEYKNAVLPDRFDCSQYYYCNNDREIKTLRCSDEYVFDGEKCELKSEVICDPSKVYRYLSNDDDENCNT